MPEQKRATLGWFDYVVGVLLLAYFVTQERRFVAKGVLEALAAITVFLAIARHLDALSEILRRSPPSVLRKEFWQAQATFFVLMLFEYAFVVACFVALRFWSQIVPDSNLVVRLIRAVSLGNPLLMAMILIGSLGLYATASVSLSTRLIPEFPEEQERIVVRG